MKVRIELTDGEAEAEFQRVSKDLLVHDRETGINTWGGSPYPTMLLWAGRIFDFLKVLEEIVGYPAARMQSYLVGHRSGADGAEVSAQFYAGLPGDDRKVQLLLAGSKVLAGAGWGRCAIEYDRDATSVSWTFAKGTAVGLAARAEGRRERPACAFISGFIAGWTNRSLGTEAEFRETECVARGDPRCRFESVEFLRWDEDGTARPRSK